MLHIHRASRADTLADALAQLLSRAPEEPLAPELVAVPTRGMERWLSQRMSGRLGARPRREDGICAHVLFPSPPQLIAGAVAVASGFDPEQDPWAPERAVWPLLEVVQAALGEPWLAPLAAYLGAGGGAPDPIRERRRLTAVRHLAALFDRYGLHRPQMLAAWRRGEDADDHGEALAPECRWQPELWRRLRARIAIPDPAQRMAVACERLREQPGLVALPARMSLFGLTRLAAGHLQVLRALAAARELHLFLLHPSPALWEKLGATIAGTGRASGPPRRRRDDPTASVPSNRLLASWGRDVREMQLVLTDGAEPLTAHDHGAPPAPDTLLGQIQRAVSADRSPPGAPLPGAGDLRPALAPDDRSIEIHSCHGRARQVEVMRDAILHAFAGDPELEPRDVIVMCPDIETFAPLIQAAFGAGEPSGDEPAAGGDRPIDLHVRLADRSLRQTNPVLGVVAVLLELAAQRLTASQLLDLADRGPVRRRFSLDDDDLSRLQEWVSQVGIRWGLNAEHRVPFMLQDVPGGTWEAGLERLLLGVTMTEDDQRLYGGVLPLDDVDSRSIDLAGRFAELVARVGAAIASLGEPQTLAGWAESIAGAADSLCAAAGRDRWQRAELQRVLDEMLAQAAGSTAQLSPAEVRAFLAERLAGRPTRANFRTGHLTVCTLMPMRSVPHRIVCLLGLDDGAFPRRAPRDGDDLMLGDPRLGERDPRSEDRQLLLDALMAATERLIVTYTGNDERTNAPRPPAVPVGELLDAIDATVRCDGGAARDRVVVRQPLQPFDARNFAAGELAGPQPWSFDTAALAGARALQGPRSPRPPFLSAPLPARPAAVIELADLVRFVEHPIRAFLRQRIGVSLFDRADEIADQLSVELDPLDRWAVGQRLLEARLRGVDERTAILAEIARGTLPPGLLGMPVVTELSPIVSAIVAQAGAAVPGLGPADPLDPVDVRVWLADGRLVSGTVNGVRGDVLLTTTFSRVAPKHRLAAWTRLLALSAGAPQRSFSAVTVGRGPGRDSAADVRIARIPPLADDPAARAAAAGRGLAKLVALYDRGMREPLPLFCQTSAAYAAAAREGRDAAEAAAGEWESGWKFPREDCEPEHQLVLGGVLTFAELLALAPPADDAAGSDGADGESRLGRYARRLWDELLAREELSLR